MTELPLVATGFTPDAGPKQARNSHAVEPKIRRVKAFIPTGLGRGRPIVECYNTGRPVIHPENLGTRNANKCGGTRRHNSGSATMFLTSSRILIPKNTWGRSS